MDSLPSPLDNPILAALTTKQAHLGHGDALARRYDADVAPFAAVACETQAAWQALHGLLSPLEQAALLSGHAISVTDTLHATPVGTIHQMVAKRASVAHLDDHDVVSLGHADSPDMLDLVARTQPGPFGKRTHEMGSYIGIRDEGRLVAMAGERMRIDGYVEISGVCVDDNWRGKGIAGRLVSLLRRQIEQQGNTAFLHVFSHNHAAISLYERLGFELRRTFFLSRIARRDA